CWKEIPRHYPSIKLDEFVVMPNHVHGIIVVVGMMVPASDMLLGGAIQESPRLDRNDPVWRRRMLLSRIIGRFKQNSAKQINIVRLTPGIPVWQRGYFDHVIRDTDSLTRIRAYIVRNSQNREMNK
ncbi:MAG: transposase, partial [Ignavibacteria bacterium]|nr:transposase [Ignavibacteria bacterium]